MGLLHDHIMSRADGSKPRTDLIQLGFDPDELYMEIVQNNAMTVDMVVQFEGVPQEVLGQYAMTWLTIGMALYKERRDAGPDDIPTLPNQPT